MIDSTRIYDNVHTMSYSILYDELGQIDMIKSITFYFVAFLQEVGSKWTSVCKTLKNYISKAAA